MADKGAVRFARRAARWIGRGIRRLSYGHALAQTTFAVDYRSEPLYHFVRSVESAPLTAHADIVRALAQQACAHCFDLLGSGWVGVHHGMRCRGLEGHRYAPGPAIRLDREGNWLEGRINRSNLTECRRIWSLIDPRYVAIDWQLDFKSGYRWSERTWYRNISTAGGMGIDIKVPWELARMQHLPLLALAQASASDDTAEPGRFAREFRNQVLDFISTNPPQFGVNWRSTMDVAIRVANWLLAYDLLRADGSVFDQDFERIFTRSVYEHGRHIVDNLEWLEELHGNHYLANIAGLTFVAVYLPRTSETDAWLAFSVQELTHEVDHQFTRDGANFEGSVCYHRLSAEISLHATALLLGLPPEKREALTHYDPRSLKTRPPLAPPPLSLYPLHDSTRTSPFPDWYWERLERMAEFTLHMTKTNGTVVQFGDNDNGRFCKIALPAITMSAADAAGICVNLADYNAAPSDPYLDENPLDHRHLVAGVNALFGRSDFAAFAPSDTGSWLISELAGHATIRPYRRVDSETAASSVMIGTDNIFVDLLARHNAVPSMSRKTAIFPAIDGPGLNDHVNRLGYPNFGAYVFRSPRIFLAVRCGSFGQSGFGGHAHLDQLAVELVLDGHSLISDPGTYLYTPLPDRRNAYRSAGAHFVPRISGKEPGNLSRNLFRIDSADSGECLYFGALGFAGRHFGYGTAVYRIVVIEAGRVVIYDFSEPGVILENPAPGKLPFSPGYGKQCRDTGVHDQCASFS